MTPCFGKEGKMLRQQLLFFRVEKSCMKRGHGKRGKITLISRLTKRSHVKKDRRWQQKEREKD